MVKAGVAWPSRSLTTLMGTPALSSRVAWVCRRSWRRMRGRPDRATWFLNASAAPPSQDVAPMANRDPGPQPHRRVERAGRSREPVDQADQALRARVPQPRPLPAPHPPRRRHHPMQDSNRHEHPNPPTQVRRVGPLIRPAPCRCGVLRAAGLRLDPAGRRSHMEWQTTCSRPCHPSA